MKEYLILVMLLPIKLALVMLLMLRMIPKAISFIQHRRRILPQGNAATARWWWQGNLLWNHKSHCCRGKRRNGLALVLFGVTYVTAHGLHSCLIGGATVVADDAIPALACINNGSDGDAGVGADTAVW